MMNLLEVYKNGVLTKISLENRRFSDHDIVSEGLDYIEENPDSIIILNYDTNLVEIIIATKEMITIHYQGEVEEFEIKRLLEIVKTFVKPNLC